MPVSRLVAVGITDVGLENKAAGVMKAGNCFTIEPMINAGSYHDDQWPDDWTAVTVSRAEVRLLQPVIVCATQVGSRNPNAKTSQKS